MKKANCLIVAGEKSGEEHCLTFLPELKAALPDIHFFGVGGGEMEKLGMELIYHLRDFSSWGISEVFHKLPFYYKAMNRLVDEVKKRDCKVAILVDFQTFNLKLAQRLKKMNVDVLYYVAPQAWAWKSWRAGALGRSVHTLFTILPFEKKWFTDRGVTRVMGVPHPLFFRFQEEIYSPQWENKRPWFEENPPRPIRLLLLPGSRDFEVQHLLPEFLQAVKELRNTASLETLLVKASSVNPLLYEYYKNEIGPVCDDADLVQALEWADVCMAASGTVTLALALFKVPTVVCYQASLLTSFIYYNFINYRGPISLTNIIHGRMIFPELIGDSVSAFNIRKNLAPLLTDPVLYKKNVAALAQTREKLLGDSFSLSQYITSVIHDRYSEKSS